MASTSIASPLRIGWQPVGYPNDVYVAQDFHTLCTIAGSQDTWALRAQAMQVQWVASRNALFVALVMPTPLGWWTMVARKTLVGSSQAMLFLPSVVTGIEGGCGAEDRGITGDQQGSHK